MNPNKRLKLVEVEPTEWMFEFSISEDIQNIYWDSTDCRGANDMESAEELLRMLLNAVPNHFDGLNDLGYVLGKKGLSIEALVFRQYAFEIGRQCLPPTFIPGRDKIQWHWLENRPFLRVCHSLGLEYQERDRTEEALELYEFILKVNPNDNQGVRALAVECLFTLNRPHDVLTVCREYPEDTLVELLYGYPLALFLTGDVEGATMMLREAMKWQPFVPQYLQQAHVKRPESNLPFDFGVAAGSATEAWYYWQRSRSFWRRRKKAMELLSECLK